MHLELGRQPSGEILPLPAMPPSNSDVTGEALQPFAKGGQSRVRAEGSKKDSKVLTIFFHVFRVGFEREECSGLIPTGFLLPPKRRGGGGTTEQFFVRVFILLFPGSAWNRATRRFCGGKTPKMLLKNGFCRNGYITFLLL
jgi:hypothetical protein